MPNNGATNGKKNNGTNNTKPNNANNDEYKRNIEESKKLLGEIENLLRQKGNNSSGSGEQGNGEQSNGGNPPGGGGKGNGGITPGSGGSTQKQSAPSIPSVGHSEIKPNAKQVPNIKQEELGQIVTPAVTPAGGNNLNKQNANKRKPLVTNGITTPPVTTLKENKEPRTAHGPMHSRSAPPTKREQKKLNEAIKAVAKQGVQPPAGSKSPPPPPPENKEAKIMTQEEANKWKSVHSGEWFKIVKEFNEYKKEKGLPNSTSFVPSYFPEMISRYLAKQQKGGGAKRRTRKRKSGRRTRKNRRTK